MSLTEKGRNRALSYLGVSKLPPRSSWKSVQSRFLLPKALGLAPGAAQRIQDVDNLAALLLKRRFGLPVSGGLGSVLQALACVELGFPEIVSLNDLKATVLSRLVGSRKTLNTDQLRKLLPRVVLEAPQGGLAGLRSVVFRDWGQGPKEAKLPLPEQTAPFDLQSFANTVRAAARDCPTGRFGDNKVFINHVWRRLRDEPALDGMDLPEFKQKLVEANAEGLLSLSRADLVQLMDPTDVQESETRHLNAEFHFILVEAQS
jgi:hypothetical protein